MTVYEALRTYCKNCAHNGNCWKPCAAVMSAITNNEDKYKEEVIKIRYRETSFIHIRTMVILSRR